MRGKKLNREADLLTAFVNTERLGEGAFDHLRELDAAVSWLRARSLLGARETLHDHERRRLVDLRAALRAAFVANVRGEEHDAHHTALVTAASLGDVRLDFRARDEVALISTARGVFRALGTI